MHLILTAEAGKVSSELMRRGYHPQDRLRLLVQTIDRDDEDRTESEPSRHPFQEDAGDLYSDSAAPAAPGG
jgi:hypothetical protein